MSRRFLGLVAMIACFGCAWQKPFDTVGLKNSKPQSLVLAVRRPGRFLVRSNKPLTPNPMIGGLVGALVVQAIAKREANLRDGKGLRASAGLPDPAAEIGKELIEDLGASLGLTPSTVVFPDVELPEADAELPPETFADPRADLILFIQTQKWSVSPERVRGETEVSFRYKSRIRFELVDTRGKRRSLVTGECETGTDGHQSRASYDDMVAVGALRVHDLIESSIEVCTDRFKGILSGTPAEPKSSPAIEKVREGEMGS